MRNLASRLSILGALLLVATISGQSPEKQPSTPSQFSGRWLVTLEMPAGESSPFEGNSLPFAIVEITGSGDSLSGKLIDGLGTAASTKLLEVKAPGDDITMLFVQTFQSEVTVRFRGRRVGDRLEGSAAPEREGGANDALKWTAERTTADKLKVPELRKADAEAAKEQKEYEEAMSAPTAAERMAAQERFIAAHSKSELATEMCLDLITSLSRSQPLDEARISRVIDAYLASVDALAPGGQSAPLPVRSLRASLLNVIADRLMVREVMLDRALAIIEQAVAAAAEDVPASERAIYQTTLGQVLFKKKDYDRAERELKRAIEIGSAESDADAHLFLGKVYEAKGNASAALEEYFAAATVGSSVDIKRSIERTYAKKNGSLAGLEDKLDEVYRKRPKPFEAGHYTRPASRQPPRVVLAELFTGAECPPCVSVDLGFDAIAERYDRDTVAVLAYHLHVPRPDPMTNTDSIARARYYRVGGTPDAVFDGGDRRGGGADVSMAGLLFGEYKKIVEAHLSKAPLAALEHFTMKAEGEAITVSGEASLTQEGASKAKKAMLRVALVQDTLRYPGGNGVRFHEFVVRSFLGGVTGKPVAAGAAKTTFAESVNVARLEAQLNQYLTDYEKLRTEDEGPFAFTDKPTKLDPSHLLVVAFVQDDETKEVLQSIVVRPAGKTTN